MQIVIYIIVFILFYQSFLKRVSKILVAIETAEFYGNEFMTALLSEEAVNYVFYELLQHESFEHIVAGS